MNRFTFFWILILLLVANPVKAQVESDSENILIVFLSLSLIHI